MRTCITGPGLHHVRLLNRSSCAVNIFYVIICENTSTCTVYRNKGALSNIRVPVRNNSGRMSIQVMSACMYGLYHGQVRSDMSNIHVKATYTVTIHASLHYWKFGRRCDLSILSQRTSTVHVLVPEFRGCNKQRNTEELLAAGLRHFRMFVMFSRSTPLFLSLCVNFSDFRTFFGLKLLFWTSGAC